MNHFVLNALKPKIMPRLVFCLTSFLDGEDDVKKTSMDDEIEVYEHINDNMLEQTAEIEIDIEDDDDYYRVDKRRNLYFVFCPNFKLDIFELENRYYF